MQFLIISGLSGAGKSRGAKALEDLGFYCVDNLPVELILQFAQYCLAAKGKYENVAFVTDVRSGLAFDNLSGVLDGLEQLKCTVSVLFFEASTEALVKRFKETRRSHPLMKKGVGLTEAVRQEREMLTPVRNRANYILDTTFLTATKLRGELIRMFAGDVPERAMPVTVLSFGFKYGIPIEADLVFDVRLLPNPYYLPELREQTGQDAAVSKFIFSYPQTAEFMGKLKSLLETSLPLYVEEGKTNLVIAVGCTGGRHRSVAVAEELGSFIAKRGYVSEVAHRDLEKDGKEEPYGMQPG